MTRLLITGCARSGTKYLAMLLHGAGVDATHERSRFRLPLSGGRGLVEANWKKAGEVEVNSDAGPHAIELTALHPEIAIGHVVRYPQEVVASMLGRGMLEHGWGIRYRDIYQPMNAYEAPMDQALAYWIMHNSRCEWATLRHTDRLPFRISEPLPALHDLLALAGIHYSPPALDESYTRTPQDVNHYVMTPPVAYDWNAHAPELREEAETMMERYGLPAAVAA